MSDTPTAAESERLVTALRRDAYENGRARGKGEPPRPMSRAEINSAEALLSHIAATQNEIRKLHGLLKPQSAQIKELTKALADKETALKASVAKVTELEAKLREKNEAIAAKDAEIERLREALKGMLGHSCVADAGDDMKDAEDHEAERRARSALSARTGEKGE